MAGKKSAKASQKQDNKKACCTIGVLVCAVVGGLFILKMLKKPVVDAPAAAAQGPEQYGYVA